MKHPSRQAQDELFRKPPRSQTKNLQTFDLQANLMTSAKPRVLLCLGETLYLGWSIGAWEVVCDMRASIKAPMNFCLEKGNARFAWWTWRKQCTKSQKSLRDFWQTHSFFSQNMDPLRVWGPKVASQIALFGTNFLRSSAVFGGSLVSHEPGHGWDGRNLGRFFEKILEVFQVLFFQEFWIQSVGYKAGGFAFVDIYINPLQSFFFPTHFVNMFPWLTQVGVGKDP